jgi:hypothetical protein
MKKIITVLVFALLFISVPYAALAGQADLKALELKARAFADQGLVTAQQEASYDYAAFFAYADPSGDWWCGLAVTSLVAGSNDFFIGCFDSNGDAVATGVFSLGEFAQEVDLIENFMDVGEITGRISIAIFATGDFLADRFQGNADGGFGELEKGGELY